MNNLIIYGIGFTAQILFAFRLIMQWIASEKAAKVLTPKVYWHASLCASSLMFIYAVLRADLVIMLGQLVSYYVYIRNIQLNNTWNAIPLFFKTFILVFPPSMVGLLMADEPNLFPAIQFWYSSVYTIGFLGQFVFSTRFIIQWYYAEKSGKPILPPGFWYASCIGAILLLCYAIARLDPVLVIGQAVGIIIYSRNLYLLRKQYCFN